MTGDIQFVLAVIFSASLLFASGRVRFDIIASMVIISLCVGGILTPEEAFAGFGNPVVVLVAGLLILSTILTRTGLAYVLGDWLIRLDSRSEWRLLLLLMGCAALLGCVMSSTAVVAILIPVAVQVARRSGISASRLLLPLSYAALISGMLTLIASIPNLVVSAELHAAGYGPFAFFAITPIGLAVLAAAMMWVVVGRFLLPGKTMVEAEPVAVRQTNRGLMNEFGLVGRGALFSLPGDSLLVGLKIKDSVFTRFSARILLVQRYEVFGESIIANPSGAVVLKPGDNILLAASEEVCDELARAAGLERRRIRQTFIERWEKEAGNAVVMVHPESNLIGRSLAGINFGDHYGVHVLAVKRRAENHLVQGKLKLEAGDTLLVAGGWDQIAELRTRSNDFVLLSRPVEAQNYVPQRRKARLAFAIVVAMVLLAASGSVPVVMAVLLAVGLGVLTSCITMDDAYRAIPWSSVVLIAGMLPVADALRKTGGLELIVNTLVAGIGSYGLLAMMSALFWMSVILMLFLSNVAAAVLLAPIAIRTAEVMGVAPQAFALTVAVAASAAFITPFSSPVVTLVVDPGGYRRLDFVKFGAPLLLLSWLLTIALAPLLFPF